MASKNPEDLHPDVLPRYRAFKTKMGEAGLKFIVTCVSRTIYEQVALWAQGREPLEFVNALRKLVGMVPIVEGENSRQVTWKLTSSHVVKIRKDKSRAFDIALLYDDGKAHWDLKADVNKSQIADYQEAGKIGESVGLKWGGYYKDYVHFEG